VQLKASTLPCPTDSCRNSVIPAESSEMRLEFVEIHRNEMNSTGMGLEWPESTGMTGMNIYLFIYELN